MPRQSSHDRGNRLPTGSDVARAAGVSKSAVSRAFTGGLVSDEKKARIFEAAKRLKYRPNLSASALTTSRSYLIGVAVTHLDNQFYPEVLERLSQALMTRRYRVVLFVTKGEADLEPVLDDVMSYRLDALVMASGKLPAGLAEECQAAGVPVMMFNNADPGGLLPSFTTDGGVGAATVARFLLAGGHKHFAMIGGIADNPASMERCEAFARTLTADGAAAPVIEYGHYSFDGATAAMGKLLRRKRRPEAVFCANDHMALAAIQSARGAGLEVGQDISIVGFDNALISAWPAFSLTSYEQPVRRMIDDLVARLMHAMEGHALEQTQFRFTGRLHVRTSARRPQNVERGDDGQDYWPDPQG